MAARPAGMYASHKKNRVIIVIDTNNGTRTDDAIHPLPVALVIANMKRINAPVGVDRDMLCPNTADTTEHSRLTSEDADTNRI